ncbi:MAG TPA: hypothetical protein PK400_13050, partial [Phycisphaerales bacterium]|nr:hypothetical protein [Phycisphaerales bacterium]
PATTSPAPALSQTVESQPSVGEVALYRFTQVRRTPERTHSLPVYYETVSWGHWYGFPSWRFHCRPIICHEFFVPGPSRRFGGFSNVSIFAWGR